MRKLLSIIVLGLIIIGCSSVRYNSPTITPMGSERKIIIDKNKDKVWDTLLSGLADRFFSINNIEKDSGFINVSFFSNDSCDYVDCGGYKTRSGNTNINLNNNIGKESASERIIPICDCDINKYGNFSSGIWQFKSCSTKIEGRINILVQEVSSEKTSLFIDIRFLVHHSSNLWNAWDGSNMYNRYDVTFESDTSGEDNGIVCTSTGNLEKEVMAIIKELI